ncbi:MAG TPA: hypothetical protein VD884_00805 [Ohtaekwangia sp.]|nr:hypothetical protein [Ohtaekwangia sp.]
MAKYDRTLPYNDLPALPPPAEIENDPEILKKLKGVPRVGHLRFKRAAASQSNHAGKYNCASGG